MADAEFLDDLMDQLHSEKMGIIGPSSVYHNGRTHTLFEHTTHDFQESDQSSDEYMSDRDVESAQEIRSYFFCGLPESAELLNSLPLLPSTSLTAGTSTAGMSVTSTVDDALCSFHGNSQIVDISDMCHKSTGRSICEASTDVATESVVDIDHLDSEVYSMVLNGEVELKRKWC